MASPAFAPRTEKYFRVPNEFAEHQHAFIPAERALALIIWRDARNAKGFTDLNGTAQISDQQWMDWTGLKPRMKELAIRGLKSKGLEVSGEGKKAKFSFNWNRWESAFRNPEPSSYDPKRKERDAKAAANKVHPDCATGCAKLREAKAAGMLETPFLVTEIAQPVARTGETAEEKWAKTMAAMRAISLDAGLTLLKLLLSALAVFGAVADGVLAAAIRNAGKYQASRLDKYGVILLVKIVPNILQAWQAKGMRLDVEPEDTSPGNSEKISPEHIRLARDILHSVDSGADESQPVSLRWKDADIQWARDILASSESS